MKFTNRPLDTNTQVDLVVYGDMGVSPIQSGAKPTIDRVLQKVISTNASAVLHIGDISYARGVGVLYWESFYDTS